MEKDGYKEPSHSDQTLLVEAMCRNDKKLIKYQLVINLFDRVTPFRNKKEKSKDIDAKVKLYDEYLEAKQEYN